MLGTTDKLSSIGGAVLMSYVVIVLKIAQIVPLATQTTIGKIKIPINNQSVEVKLQVISVSVRKLFLIRCLLCLSYCITLLIQS